MSAANENCDYKEALKLQEAGSHTQVNDALRSLTSHASPHF